MKLNPLTIEGTIDNDVTFNGRNVELNGGTSDGLIVRSVFKDGKWLVPENITIKNYTIKGAIRVYGLGVNGQGDLVKESSRKPNHIKYCQETAPKNITFENLIVEANQRIPFYIAPGCTNITLRNCIFKGKSVSTTVYIDCESGYNTIENNVFETKNRRESVAIDGSAYNTIRGNTFKYPFFGGVRLYRNSGEGGTIRHQTPSYNTIENNKFVYGILAGFIGNIWRTFFPTIWGNSRSSLMQYFYRWRNDDAGYGFGSSVNNNDLGKGNVIQNNYI